MAVAMFYGTPDPLSPLSTLTDSENSVRYKSEVETIPETGSTNNLTTETDIDAISVAIPMFLGRFSLVYMPTSSDAFFTHKFQDGGWIPEVVITLRRKTISR